MNNELPSQESQRNWEWARLVVLGIAIGILGLIANEKALMYGGAAALIFGMVGGMLHAIRNNRPSGSS